MISRSLCDGAVARLFVLVSVLAGPAGGTAPGVFAAAKLPGTESEAVTPAGTPGSGSTETAPGRAAPDAAVSDAGGADTPEPKGNADPPRQLFRGRVLLAQEALKKRGITVADEMKNQAVLETLDGELIPIAADWRGRAFFQDKRLRNRRVDLVGYRRPGIPWLQTLIIFVINEQGEREVMDYWCDICAIPMYEIKDCECCQGPIRLRLQPGRLPDYLQKRDAPSRGKQP